ncbi:MAG: hypothetical protein FWG87_00070 [Defluviitaleaceae bacterium]|nr:hypothetical protein [Defluviitaleaceae bacterium]
MERIIWGALLATGVTLYAAWINKHRDLWIGRATITDKIPWRILALIIFVAWFIILSIYTLVAPQPSTGRDERTQYIIDRMDWLRDEPSSTLILEIMLDWYIIDQAQHDAMLYDMDYIRMFYDIPPEFWAEADIGVIIDKFYLFARTFAITPEP